VNVRPATSRGTAREQPGGHGTQRRRPLPFRLPETTWYYPPQIGTLPPPWQELASARAVLSRCARPARVTPPGTCPALKVIAADECAGTRVLSPFYSRPWLIGS
jgi:hypothetical protein